MPIRTRQFFPTFSMSRVEVIIADALTSSALPTALSHKKIIPAQRMPSKATSFGGKHTQGIYAGGHVFKVNRITAHSSPAQVVNLSCFNFAVGIDRQWRARQPRKHKAMNAVLAFVPSDNAIESIGGLWTIPQPARRSVIGNGWIDCDSRKDADKVFQSDVFYGKIFDRHQAKYPFVNLLGPLGRFARPAA